MEEPTVLLKNIESALWIIIYLFAASILVRSVFMALELKKTLSALMPTEEEKFNHTLDDLYERAKYDDLIKIAEAKLISKPNSAYANWFLARTFLRKSDYDKALKYTNESSEISPNWESEYLEPLRLKIEKSKGSKT